MRFNYFNLKNNQNNIKVIINLVFDYSNGKTSINLIS